MFDQLNMEADEVDGEDRFEMAAQKNNDEDSDVLKSRNLPPSQYLELPYHQ